VHATPPCEHDTTAQPSPSLIDAYCPTAGVQRIAIALRDGDDVLSLGGIGPVNYPATVRAGAGNDRVRGGSLDDSIYGGPGNDVLDGAGGADLLAGGRGDDVINAQDGFADRVVCGAGVDRVSSDAIDLIDRSCEVVNGVPRGPGGR
jgi:Ca2+-binding RTX toxin-like protein